MEVHLCTPFLSRPVERVLALGPLANMRQLPPLEPSYDPILIRTNRRLDLQSLINVLYQSILRRDASRASKAWSILVRCESSTSCFQPY